MTSKIALVELLETLSKFQMQDESRSSTQERKCISIWIHADAKLIFDEAQRRSKKKLGKLLQDALEDTLKQLNLEDVG